MLGRLGKGWSCSERMPSVHSHTELNLLSPDGENNKKNLAAVINLNCKIN